MFLALCYALFPVWRSFSWAALACSVLCVLAVVFSYRWAFRVRSSARPGPQRIGSKGRRGPRPRPDPLAIEERVLIARHESVDLQWYGKGATLRVGPYTLRDPLLYVTSGDRFVDEVSAIALDLPVGKPGEEPPGSLGFFPEYAALSPAQRASYLQWLAGGRSGPLLESRYASLFFAGLERRALIEGKDVDLILGEVERLLKAYGFLGPLRDSLSCFLSYNLARAGIDAITEDRFRAAFQQPGAWLDAQHLAVGLAWLYRKQRPLPPEWALRLAERDPAAPRSTLLRQLPNQFVALFVKRYREQHGEGLLLRTARRAYMVDYEAANPSLAAAWASSRTPWPKVPIPNVMEVPGQFAPLLPIWTRCLDELKPVSRVLAKGAKLSSRAAYDALPEALKAGAEHPDKPVWQRLAAEKREEDGTALVAVGELAGVQGIAERPKLTAKQSESIARTAQAVGFIIEPDARRTGRAYRWDETVALYRPEGPPDAPEDARYPGAALLLELGMFVAAADGQIGDGEVGSIAGFLEAQFQLAPADVRRLEALKRVFLKQPPSISGIGKRLQAILSAEQLESAGAFLVGVAAAAGPIRKKQAAALRSAYRALKVDAERLETLLEEYRRLEKEPVEVRPELAPADGGEAIPPRAAKGPRPPIRLDAALVERLMHETRQVARLLGQAMLEEQPEPGPEPGPAGEPTAPAQPAAPAPAPAPAPAADPRFEGLAVRYHAVLTALCTRPSWTRTEFEALVREHSLMPSAVLDVINEWSQDRAAEPILEELGDDLVVHAGIVMEPV